MELLSEGYKQTLLTLVKQRLGILSAVRDAYLNARLLASITSLTAERGVLIDESDMNLIMFIVDYTEWQYRSVTTNQTWQYQGAKSSSGMPINLRQRLNNILMKYTGGEANGDL